MQTKVLPSECSQDNRPGGSFACPGHVTSSADLTGTGTEAKRMEEGLGMASAASPQVLGLPRSNGLTWTTFPSILLPWDNHSGWCTG